MGKMIFRFLVLVSFFFVLNVFSSYDSSSNRDQGQVGGKMSLTFCHSLGGQPGNVLQEIVQEYNKDHNPQVELQVVEPQNYASAAKEALKKPEGERPHFILAPEYMTGAMQEALKEGIVVSVNSLLDKEKLDDIAEIVTW